MKHLTSLIVKFVFTTILLEILLNIMTNLSIWQILWLSLIVTAITYVAGDMLVLPLSNNIVATIANTLLTFAILYMYNLWADYTSIGIFDAIISAVVFGVADWFYHKYIHSNIFTDNRQRSEG